MEFKIIRQCFQKISSVKDNGNYEFYLEEDKWNDYSFHTLYHIHAGKKLTGKDPEYLGPINIMRKGQQEYEKYLVRDFVGTSFNNLPDEFCSLSMSVELYRGLDRLLNRADERKSLVNSLKLIFSEEDERYKEFCNEECFSKSLLRNATMNAYGLSLGKEIMLDESSSYDLSQVPLTFTLPHDNGKVDFDFSSINLDLQKTIDLPSRLLVCIGNNGAGKSTILYRLARILFATPAARSQYADDLGFITPSDAGFRRLFLISYSAFDNFILPGVDLNDYNLILEGLKNREGRLVYCGIRDVESEYKEKIDSEQSKNNPFPIEIQDVTKLIDRDHEKIHKLKTVENLASETIQACCSIAQDNNKRNLWNELMQECEMANSSFSEMVLSKFAYILSVNDDMLTTDKFKHLSTGVKYLLHSLSQIIDRIEPNSIIIFDEPENHIQPPLLCKFLYCLRKIAHRYRSLVLVATHSPVIVQETLAKNVIIVNRNNDKWFFRHPSIETYGENIGNITDEVFNLNTSVTNYQKTASELFKHYISKFTDYSDPLDFIGFIANDTGLEFGNEIKAFLISKFIEYSDSLCGT